MNYGMYISASGVLVNSHRMDVLSNNLANVNTAGFKPQFSDVQARESVSQEDGPFDPGLSRQMLEQLGGGVFAAAHHTSFNAAATVSSENQWDVALASNNTFFAVEATDPTTGQAQVYLTRNGRFDARGELVTTSGHRVLSGGDSAIDIPEGTVSVTVSSQGEIRFLGNDGVELGTSQFQVVTADTDGLEHAGEGLFAMTNGDTRRGVDNPDVRQYHYESSGTSPIQTMMQIVAATKAATGNANMIRYHDQMMNQSINTFARLS